MRSNPKPVHVKRFRTESTQLLFLYQGGAGMLFIPPMRFLRLIGANNRNLSMLRDPGANFYHGELHPDLPDIYATIEHQRQVKQQCPQAAEFYCAGTSMGAYAAILFGHYLAADCVHAFGARSLVNLDIVDPSIAIPSAHRDLSVLLANWNGRTQYKLYYCEGFEPDRVAAERMSDTPGVELCPVPGKTHNVFKEINAAKLLRGLLPPLQESRWWKS